MKIKLIIVAILCFAMLPFGAFACKKELKVDIALITTEKSALNDKSFNESAYDGIKRYADGAGKAYKAYEPNGKDKDDYLEQIAKAAKAGAEIIVTPGYNFETAVFEAQDLYPNVKFVLADGVPNNGKYDATHQEKVAANTLSIFFAEEQAGFFAGYAVVKDGFRNLGFFGGLACLPVTSYGFGYIMGANLAAGELGLDPEGVEIKYVYGRGFVKDIDYQTTAASWYNSGTEVIFACGGQGGLSIVDAAKNLPDKWVIGVDVDQGYVSDKIITSAMKMLSNAVYAAVKGYYDGSFQGGRSVMMDASNDGVGLTVGTTAKLRTFSEADYTALFNKVKNDTDGITTELTAIRNRIADEGDEFKPTDLAADFSVSNVKVTFEKL